ncbi:MAG: hypothetical protein ACEPOW_09835 [Bacteroidales bacterium]
MKAFYLSILVIFSLLFSSCKKKSDTSEKIINPEVKTSNLISKITSSDPYGYFNEVTFDYNSENQITKINSPHEWGLSYCKMQYNNENRLTQYLVCSETEIPKKVNFDYKEGITNITVKEKYNIESEITYVFELDNNNMPSLITEKRIFEGNCIKKIHYKINCEGKNITRIEKDLEYGKKIWTITYDNHRNFLLDIRGDNYLFFYDEDIFNNWFPSENNITSIRTENIIPEKSRNYSETKKFIYTYDKQGDPRTVKTGILAKDGQTLKNEINWEIDYK